MGFGGYFGHLFLYACLQREYQFGLCRWQWFYDGAFGQARRSFVHGFCDYVCHSKSALPLFQWRFGPFVSFGSRFAVVHPLTGSDHRRCQCQSLDSSAFCWGWLSDINFGFFGVDGVCGPLFGEK